jgi:hypothetical protein
MLLEQTDLPEWKAANVCALSEARRPKCLDLAGEKSERQPKASNLPSFCAKVTGHMGCALFENIHSNN